MEKILAKASTEGKVVFMRGDATKKKECICCDGPAHIFCRLVEFSFDSDYPAHFRRDADLFVSQLATRNQFEGKRVRITVEVIE